MRHRRTTTTFLLALCALAALTACTTTTTDDGGEGSRATLYASIDELSADSTAIVLGEVTAQREDGDATVSELSVGSAPTNPRLGEDAPDADAVAVGDVVEVRQDAASRPLLEVGGQYVLWLTPSGLPGDAAEQFFITGSNAGLYVRDGDTAVRAASDTGDGLPDSITLTGTP